MAKATGTNKSAPRVAQAPATPTAVAEVPAEAPLLPPAEVGEVAEVKPDAADPVVTRLQVTSRRAGFRRAGRAWPATPVVVASDEFTEAQIEQLLAEPMLSVQPIAD